MDPTNAFHPLLKHISPTVRKARCRFRAGTYRWIPAMKAATHENEPLQEPRKARALQPQLSQNLLPNPKVEDEWVGFPIHVFLCQDILIDGFEYNRAAVSAPSASAYYGPSQPTRPDLPKSTRDIPIHKTIDRH